MSHFKKCSLSVEHRYQFEIYHFGYKYSISVFTRERDEGMKKVFVLLLCIILIGTASGCGHIEDTNGVSTELVTISMEKLTSNSSSSTSSGVSVRSTRQIITSTMEYEELDVDSLVMSGGKISGVSTIMGAYIYEGEGLVIDSQTSLEAGNFKMVLISPSKELLYEFETGKKDTCEIVAAEDGFYRIRIGAESFTGEIKLGRTLYER